MMELLALALPFATSAIMFAVKGLIGLSMAKKRNVIEVVVSRAPDRLRRNSRAQRQSGRDPVRAGCVLRIYVRPFGHVWFLSAYHLAVEIIADRNYVRPKSRCEKMVR
jgi:hypothetical protein